MNRKEALRQHKIRQLKKDVKHPAEGAVINTMLDPNVKAEEATAPVAEQATEQQNAQESVSQDQAMGVNSEEGTTEG